MRHASDVLADRLVQEILAKLTNHGRGSLVQA